MPPRPGMCSRTVVEIVHNKAYAALFGHVCTIPAGALDGHMFVQSYDQYRYGAVGVGEKLLG